MCGSGLLTVTTKVIPALQLTVAHGDLMDAMALLDELKQARVALDRMTGTDHLVFPVGGALKLGPKLGRLPASDGASHRTRMARASTSVQRRSTISDTIASGVASIPSAMPFTGGSRVASWLLSRLGGM